MSILDWNVPFVSGQNAFFTKESHDRYSCYGYQEEMGPVGDFRQYLREKEAAINKGSHVRGNSQGPPNEPGGGQEAGAVPLEVRYPVSAGRAHGGAEITTAYVHPGGQISHPGKAAGQTTVVHHGKVSHGQQTVPFPRKSWLTQHDQRRYLELYNKYVNFPPVQPTQDELIEMNILKELQARVSPEQEEFMSYLRQVADNSPDSYNYIHHQAKQYVEEKIAHMCRRVKQYPRHYQNMDTVHLSISPDVRHFPPLVHVRSLLELGQIPKVILPNMTCGARPYLPTDYSKVGERVPPIPARADGPRIWNKEVCSHDWNAEVLAQKYGCNVVLSSGGLKCLLDNLGPEFDRAWELPVTVKEYEVSDNGRTFMHKVVFVDKPFVSRRLSNRQKNAMFHKAALKTLVSHPEKGHQFGARRAEAFTAVKHVPGNKNSFKIASQSKKETSANQNACSKKSSADDLFGGGDARMEDLETFGMSKKYKDIHSSFVRGGTQGKQLTAGDGSDLPSLEMSGSVADAATRHRTQISNLSNAVLCIGSPSLDDTSKSLEGKVLVGDVVHAENETAATSGDEASAPSKLITEQKQIGRLLETDTNRSWPTKLEICRIKPETSFDVSSHEPEPECNSESTVDVLESTVDVLESTVDVLEDVDTSQQWLSETEVKCLESSRIDLQHLELEGSRTRIPHEQTDTVLSGPEISLEGNSQPVDKMDMEVCDGAQKSSASGAVDTDCDVSIAKDSLEIHVGIIPLDSIAIYAEYSAQSLETNPAHIAKDVPEHETVMLASSSHTQENQALPEITNAVKRGRGRPRKVKAKAEVISKHASKSESETPRILDKKSQTTSRKDESSALENVDISGVESATHLEKLAISSKNVDVASTKTNNKEEVDANPAEAANIIQTRRQSLRTSAAVKDDSKSNPEDVTLPFQDKFAKAMRLKASIFSSDDSSVKDTSEDDGGKLVIDASPDEETPCKMALNVCDEKSPDEISEEVRTGSSSTPVKPEAENSAHIETTEPSLRQSKRIFKPLQKELLLNEEKPNCSSSDEEESALIIDYPELVDLFTLTRSKATIARRRSPRILAQVSDSTDAEGDVCPPQKRGRKGSTIQTYQISVSGVPEVTMPRRRSGRLSNSSAVPEASEEVEATMPRPTQRKRGRPPKKPGHLVDRYMDTGKESTKNEVKPELENEGDHCNKEDDGIASPDDVRKNLSDISEIQEPSDVSELEPDSHKPVIIPLSPQYGQLEGHVAQESKMMGVPVPTEILVSPGIDDTASINVDDTAGRVPESVTHKRRRRGRQLSGVDKPNPLDTILQMQEKMLHGPTNEDSSQSVDQVPAGRQHEPTELLQGSMATDKGRSLPPLGQLHPPPHTLGHAQSQQQPAQPQSGQRKENPADYFQPANNLNVTYHLWSFAGKPLLIRSGCHGFRRDINQQLSYLTMCPKLEYQSVFGMEQVTKSEAIRNWVAAYIRQNCPLVRARINAFTSELIMLEELDASRIVPSVFSALPAQGLNLLHSVLSKLESLSTGHYLLTHTKGDNSCQLRKSMEGNKRGDYDLHFSYTGFTCAEREVNVGIPWIPIDPAVLLPFHWKNQRIPATFEPPDYVGQQKGQQGGPSQQKKSKKKKNKGRNRRK